MRGLLFRLLFTVLSYFIVVLLVSGLAWPLIAILLVTAGAWIIWRRTRIKNLEAKLQRGETSPEEELRLQEYERQQEIIKKITAYMQSKEFKRKIWFSIPKILGFLFILSPIGFFWGGAYDAFLFSLICLMPIGIIMILGRAMRDKAAFEKDKYKRQ